MQPLCIHCAGRFLFHTCGIRTLFIYFTNHVGEQRNFCFAEIRRPACVCSTNSTLSAQRLARNCPLFSFMTNSSLTASISGCRGRQPLHQSSTAAKSLSLFADFALYKRTQKAVQSFHSDTALLISLLYFSL